ncbi:hypothetical protein AAVH_08251 [Aphelenchoides avenae]|nr:hypothetical protein AAVH_08251 [Aphelenchus avenae]
MLRASRLGTFMKCKANTVRLIATTAPAHQLGPMQEAPKMLSPHEMEWQSELMWHEYERKEMHTMRNPSVIGTQEQFEQSMNERED